MIARPMTRFDSTPRKIDGGTFFRNPARAATSASGSVVTMIYVSRLFFVIDTPSQMASTDGSSTNEEISGVIDGYATIGCSIRFQKKKKKKSEREKRGEEAWKKKNEKREREREMKNRTNQILTTRVRCYQNLTSFPCYTKTFQRPQSCGL